MRIIILTTLSAVASISIYLLGNPAFLHNNTFLYSILGHSYETQHFYFLAYLSCFSGFSPLPLFLLGLGKGLRPLYAAGLLATALLGFFIFLFNGLNFYLLYSIISFFVFSLLGIFILVNRALLHYKIASGEVIWYSSSSLLRDFVLLSLVIFCLQLGKHLYWHPLTLLDVFGETFSRTIENQEDPKLISRIFENFVIVFDIFSWIFKMIINGLLAQWILVKFKLNLRPSFAAEKIFTTDLNQSQIDFFNFVKTNPTETIENFFNNTRYYLHYFTEYKKKNSFYKTLNFNFSAAIFMGSWFLYRKMYVYGLILTLFFISIEFLPLYILMFIYPFAMIICGFIGTPLYIKFSENNIKKGCKQSGISALMAFFIPFLLTFLIFYILGLKTDIR